MIQNDDKIEKGVITEDGVKKNAVKDGFIEGEYLVLRLYKWEDTSYNVFSHNKVLGDPLKKNPSEKIGNITLFSNNICTYVDEKNLLRMVDLDDHDAFNRDKGGLSVNNEITVW